MRNTEDGQRKSNLHIKGRKQILKTEIQENLSKTGLLLVFLSTSKKASEIRGQ